uniref:Uncharacterized protein LOC111137896 n=1 Tax=Crassostrea virginica TaxID=6565 RepID=A0A8B8F0K3_CRAVI|nr:uncharacterized protein LOC111137896 [Crassostrea virginica]
MGRSIELLFISILLVNFALIQAAPCETGRSKYSISKGRCVRCKCPKGTEFSKNKDIPYDKELGALQCPNCTRCAHNFYSNARTGFTCVECSTPCDERRRVILIPCNGMVNVRCGACKEGYYERLEGDVSCTPCGEDTGRPECVSNVTRGPAVPFIKPETETLAIPAKGIDDNQVPGSPPTTDSTTSSSQGSHMILIILCVVVLILGTVVVLIFIKIIPKCCSFSQWSSRHFGSNSTCSNGSSGSLLKDGRPNNDLEIDAVHTEDCVELDEETSRRMKTKTVHRDDRLLLVIATKIDREPSDAFQELGIGRSVIFQEKENQSRRGLDTSEYYLTVLQKWAEKNHLQATQMALYEAFHKTHVHSVCHIILSDCILDPFLLK